MRPPPAPRKSSTSTSMTLDLAGRRAPVEAKEARSKTRRRGHTREDVVLEPSTGTPAPPGGGPGCSRTAPASRCFSPAADPTSARSSGPATSARTPAGPAVLRPGPRPARRPARAARARHRVGPARISPFGADPPRLTGGRCCCSWRRPGTRSPTTSAATPSHRPAAVAEVHQPAGPRRQPPVTHFRVHPPPPAHSMRRPIASRWS